MRALTGRPDYVVSVIDPPEWKVVGVEVVEGGGSIRVIVEDTRDNKQRVGDLSAGELVALVRTRPATYS